MPNPNKMLFGRPALFFDLAEILIDAALEEARRSRRPPARPAPVGRNLTLRPGVATPRWNELVRQIRPHLRKRGTKAQLARLLGLPRQRLQDCLKAGSASLDAERTLQLVGWLGFFQRGGELTPGVRPGRPRRDPQKPAIPGNL